MAKRGRPKRDSSAYQESGAQTQVPPLGDRMIHPTRPGPEVCPSCGAFPVVTKMKRPNYASYRCRVCDHAWEEGQR
jgi:hypothetical protein